MNSYFDHSSTAGFYNPAHQAAAEAHQAAYRSFSQSLSLVPSATQSYGQSGTRSNSTPSETSNNYTDPACKLYDGSQSSSNFKTDCISKETNGFKTPSNSDPMTPTSGWNSSALRPSPSSVSMAGMAADPMRSFDAAAAACSRSVTDAWSACCQGGSGGSANFYPWMAIAGKTVINILFSHFQNLTLIVNELNKKFTWGKGREKQRLYEVWDWQEKILSTITKVVKGFL